MLAPHDVVLLCDGLQKQIKNKPNVLQMHVYHLVAVLYSMKDRFNRFAWEVYQFFNLNEQETVLNLLRQTIPDNSFVFTESDEVSKKRGS